MTLNACPVKEPGGAAGTRSAAPSRCARIGTIQLPGPLAHPRNLNRLSLPRLTAGFRIRIMSADESDALQMLRASGEVRQLRSVWSACVFSAAFPRHSALRLPASLLKRASSFLRVHWDHESNRTNKCNNCYTNLASQEEVHKSLVGLAAVRRDHEPLAVQ